MIRLVIFWFSILIPEEISDTGVFLTTSGSQKVYPLDDWPTGPQGFFRQFLLLFSRQGCSRCIRCIFSMHFHVLAYFFFFFFLKRNIDKTKNMILTIKRQAKYQFAGLNTQQVKRQYSLVIIMSCIEKLPSRCWGALVNIIGC